MTKVLSRGFPREFRTLYVKAGGVSHIVSGLPFVSLYTATMSLQLIVSVTGTGNVLNLSLPSAGDLGISEAAERETAAAFLGCVGEAAKRDSDLTKDQSKQLQLQPDTGSAEQDTATEVGRMYSRLGAEIDYLRTRTARDPKVRDFVDTCVRDLDSRRASNTAFDKFMTIVPIVVGCDENGVG